jgi:hypothetical protein
MELIQQLTPALAALHQQDAGVSHGALTADRSSSSPEGRFSSSLSTCSVRPLSRSSPPIVYARSSVLAVVRNDDAAVFDGRIGPRSAGFHRALARPGRRLDPGDYPISAESYWTSSSGVTATVRWPHCGCGGGWNTHFNSKDAVLIQHRGAAGASRAPGGRRYAPGPQPVHRTLHALPEPAVASAEASSDTLHDLLAEPNFPFRKRPSSSSHP